MFHAELCIRLEDKTYVYVTTESVWRGLVNAAINGMLAEISAKYRFSSVRVRIWERSETLGSLLVSEFEKLSGSI